MVFWIQCHPMISLTLSDRIATDDLVRRRFYHCKYILVLQIHVHLPRNGVVLRHSRLAVEVQRADDLILLNINDGFRFSRSSETYSL